MGVQQPERFVRVIVRFWGVRGSLPVPGSETVQVGGNTACVSVEAAGTVLVLDAGTGIKALGDRLAGGEHRIILMLSHPHWDHLMGMPFFAPLYESDRHIDVVDFVSNGRAYSPLELIDGVHFPLSLADLPARLVTAAGDGSSLLREHGFELRRHPVNHPGGADGFRITHGGASLVYMTDNEIDPPEGAAASFESLVDFCRNVELLCHDAQYLPGEHTDRWGWGHSSLPRVCDLAIAAAVRHLVLFHHDPDRTDGEIAAMEREGRVRLEAHGIRCTAAREGLTLEL